MSRLDGLDSLLDEFRARAERDPTFGPYVHFHAPRYRFLLAQVEQVLAPLEHPRVLDVGHSWESEAMRRLFPHAVVDTLGFEDSRFPPREGERHIVFNLNDAQDPARWPGDGGYDLAVAAEVLEHLYTAPELVLSCLASLLRPGGILIVQTPNAAAFVNRVKLLVGRHPFERIRLTPTNPGHFREYTVDELLEIGGEAGLEVVTWTTRNYFLHDGLVGRLHDRIAPLLPAGLRDGITVQFRRPR